MRLITAVLVIALTLSFAGPVMSAGFESGDVVVVSLPVGNDLYIGGGKVVVTKSVTGDLVAAGGSMVINGPVGADLCFGPRSQLTVRHTAEHDRHQQR